MFRSFRDLAVLVFMYPLSKFSVQIQPLGSIFQDGEGEEGQEAVEAPMAPPEEEEEDDEESGMWH